METRPVPACYLCGRELITFQAAAFHMGEQPLWNSDDEIRSCCQDCLQLVVRLILWGGPMADAHGWIHGSRGGLVPPADYFREQIQQHLVKFGQADRPWGAPLATDRHVQRVWKGG